MTYLHTHTCMSRLRWGVGVNSALPLFTVLKHLLPHPGVKCIHVHEHTPTHGAVLSPTPPPDGGIIKATWSMTFSWQPLNTRARLHSHHWSGWLSNKLEEKKTPRKPEESVILHNPKYHMIKVIKVKIVRLRRFRFFFLKKASTTKPGNFFLKKMKSKNWLH